MFENVNISNVNCGKCTSSCTFVLTAVTDFSNLGTDNNSETHPQVFNRNK